MEIAGWDDYELKGEGTRGLCKYDLGLMASECIVLVNDDSVHDSHPSRVWYAQEVHNTTTVIPEKLTIWRWQRQFDH